MSRAEQAAIEAATWIIAQEDGALSASEQAAFDAWFAASDGNKAAYWRLELGWQEADRIGALGGQRAWQSRSPRSAWRWFVPTSIAASLALFVGAQLLDRDPARVADAPQIAQVYATPVGGSSSVDLVDGSRVELNTATRMRTGVTASRREVWIDQGEAFFEVAHKDGQPFVVHAGDRRVTVLGTKFSVRRDGADVAVTVLEGRVRVEQLKDGEAIRSTIITGGEIALAKGPATMLTTRSAERVERVLSWRSGMLTFDQDNLASIAAEFNRYNDRKLVVTDASAAATRIGGVFPADDPEAFVELLRDAYGLKVTETGDEIKISD